MNKFGVVFLVACVVATVSAASLKNELKKPVAAADEWRGHIAGGMVAQPDQFPYQAALLTADDLHYCGGAILNQRWVVTAGSCVLGKALSDIVVVVGTHRLSVGGQRRNVDRIVAHPNYDVESYFNDVAVIRVSQPLIFSDSIQPIGMRADFVEAETNAIASGFGRQAISDNAPADMLRYIEVDVITQDECQEAFDEPYTERLADNTVCSSSSDGQGVCLGDAGGPLVYNDQLVGVISWGVPCGLGLPDVYARISSHRAWILVHTMV